jgi:rod shape-determining protein MreC
MRKLNLVALAVFLGALVWVFILPAATTRRIQNRVGSIFAPFKRTGANVQDAVTGANEEKHTPEQLRALNEKLATENAELKIYRDREQQILGELNRVNALLKFEQRTELSLIPAKIIVRKTSAWYRGATIDKGSRQGVQDGSPVILPTGPEGRASLVGRVYRAGENESEILFITDELCKVAGQVEGAKDELRLRGMLEGVRVSTSRRPELRLRYLTKDAKVEKNRRVISSDDTNRFPPGLTLGTVVDVRPGDASSEAVVEPAVNLDDLPYVFVMEQKVEEKSPPSAPPPR